MPTTQPNIGYGQPSETTIDNANIYMRGQPWYQEQMRQWGQDPGHPTLSQSQSQQILKLAQAHGFVVDEGNMEVDDHGNFNPQGHKLRNTMIVIGAVAAGLVTAGLAIPAIAGAGGAGAAAGGAGLAGVEGGAAGLSSGALAGLGTGAMGAVALPASVGAAGAAGAGAAAFDAAGNFIGPSTVSSVGAGGGSSLWSQLANHAGDIGGAIGKATSAAGQNRVNQEGDALQANRDNTVGNQAYENQLMARAKQDASERHNALIDVARASDERNPNISPFNSRGPKTYSPEYLSTLTALEQAGVKRLAADPTNGMNTAPPLRPYKPIDITDVQGATGTRPSIWEQIGNYAAPALTTYGAFAGQSDPRYRTLTADERARGLVLG